MPDIDGNDADNILFGTNDQDIVFANGGNDRVFAQAEDDVIFGGDGSDVLFGGPGEDLLSGSDALPADSDGALDSLAGDSGNDRYFIFDNQDVVVEFADGGSDTVQFENDTYTLGANLENLQFERTARVGIGNGLGNRMTVTKADDDTGKTMEGRDRNDFLTSAAGDDRLFGGNDGDLLIANAGNDSLNGGNGNDNMLGGDGVDRLKGGAGNDFLNGGALGDVVTGGAGNDIFSYTGTGGSSGSIAATRDTITDFTRGQDEIQLTFMDADTVRADDQDFAFIGSQAFTGAAQLRVVQVAGGTLIEGNTDFDSTAELTILLDDRLALTAGDFEL